MNFDSLLIWLVIVLSVILLTALLSLPGKSQSKKIMTLFVVNFTLHFLAIYFSEFSPKKIPLGLNPFFFSNYGPLLWLYFLCFKKQANPLGYKSYLNFLPALILLLWGQVATPTFDGILMVSLVVLAINFGYIFKCLRHYLMMESTYDLKDKKWLLSLLVLFTTLMLMASVNLFFSMGIPNPYHSSSLTLLFLIAVLILAAVVYFSIIAPELFNNFKQKYWSSSLRPDESLQLAQQITTFLRQEERFVQPDLGLNSIARALGASPKNVSQAINQHLGDNFYAYLNTLRINKAMALLDGDTTDDLPIKNVMYDCGFNNKTTFNKAFKTRTGLTPSAYKKEHARKG